MSETPETSLGTVRLFWSGTAVGALFASFGSVEMSDSVLRGPSFGGVTIR